MLVISRKKVGEAIQIGDSITVVYLGPANKSAKKGGIGARLGVIAPLEIRVSRVDHEPPEPGVGEA